MMSSIVMRASTALVARLASDRRGIAAAEFAIVAPMVLLLFSAVWSMLFLQLGAIALEGGVTAAARQAIIGSAPPGMTREEMIRETITRYVCPRSLGIGTVCYWNTDLAGETALTIDMLAYVDPRNIGQPERFSDENDNGAYDMGEPYVDSNDNGRWDPDMGVASAGGAGDHVVYDVRMVQTVDNLLLTPVLGETMTRRAQLVVRNEPWDGQ